MYEKYKRQAIVLLSYACVRTVNDHRSSTMQIHLGAQAVLANVEIASTIAGVGNVGTKSVDKAGCVMGSSNRARSFVFERSMYLP